MEAAKIVLVNFHFSGALIAKDLELNELTRTPEEMKAKELERARNQNPGLQRNKADDGVPPMGRYGEPNLHIKGMVQSLLDDGFKLIEAYKQATYKTRWVDGKPVVTNQRIGTVARFVFSKDPASVPFLSPEEAEKKLALLMEGLEGFTAPCVHVYHNYGPDKTSRTTDTVNIATLNRDDERNEISPGELNYNAGVFSVSRRRSERF